MGKNEFKGILSFYTLLKSIREEKFRRLLKKDLICC
jgi:hypothetical protein